jgi:hypothetical protein
MSWHSHPQVESVKLSSESAARCMEADLANARREAATVAANHKNDLANWRVGWGAVQLGHACRHN